MATKQKQEDLPRKMEKKGQPQQKKKIEKKKILNPFFSNKTLTNFFSFQHSKKKNNVFYFARNDNGSVHVSFFIFYSAKPIGNSFYSI